MACSITGANCKLAIKEETTFGTKATGNYVYVPFISATVGGTEDLFEDYLMGLGRDAQRPLRDTFTVAGDVVVPIDVTEVGYWLKMLLGAPTTSGSTDKTHLFTSGVAALPSFTVEFQHSDATTAVYRTLTGVMADSATLQVGSTGRPQISLRLVAINEEVDNTSDAGTPTTAAVERHTQKTSFITRESVALGKVTDVSLDVNNNLQSSRYIGGGGLIGCIVPGSFLARGRLTVRPNDTTMHATALAGTTGNTTFGWTMTSTKQFVVGMAESEFVRAGRSVGGPGVIEVPYTLVASKVLGTSSMYVSLLNQKTTY